MERHGGLRSDDGGAGLRRRQREGCHDRCNLPEGAPHGIEPAGKKRGPDDQRGRLIGRTKGGLNTKLHAVTDAMGQPLRFFMTAGQVSDYTGAPLSSPWGRVAQLKSLRFIEYDIPPADDRLAPAHQMTLCVHGFVPIRTVDALRPQVLVSGSDRICRLQPPMCHAQA